MKEKPLLQVDLQVEIGTVTKTKEKKENLYIHHNGPKCAQMSLSDFLKGFLRKCVLSRIVGEKYKG